MEICKALVVGNDYLPFIRKLSEKVKDQLSFQIKKYDYGFQAWESEMDTFNFDIVFIDGSNDYIRLKSGIKGSLSKAVKERYPSVYIVGMSMESSYRFDSHNTFINTLATVTPGGYEIVLDELVSVLRNIGFLSQTAD